MEGRSVSSAAGTVPDVSEIVSEGGFAGKVFWQAMSRSCSEARRHAAISHKARESKDFRLSYIRVQTAEIARCFSTFA